MSATRRPAAKPGKSAGATSRALVGPPAEDRVSFQVHRVNAKLAQVANRLFRAHGIDVIGSRILIFLLEREEMRVGELVEVLALPQSTISHQIQRLDKAKLVRRRRTIEDNRAVAVMLTPAGRQAALDCNAFSLEVYHRMTENLSEREIRLLRALLVRMFEVLSDVEAAQQAESR